MSDNTASDSMTTTDQEWTYTSMAPEVAKFLRGRKNNLETIPMFMGASTAKWNIKNIKVDGKRTRVSYVATNPRADVRAFVEAALTHAEKDVPTTDKGLADAFTKAVMKKYAKHLAAQRNLAASINAAHDGKAWWAEGINRPFMDQFAAAKAWHREQDPKWSEAFNGVKDRRKKIIAAANTWQGNADGTKSTSFTTTDSNGKTVRRVTKKGQEARKPKQVTKANMIKALKGAGLEVDLKEKVDQVRARYQGAVACGIITGGSA